MAPDRISSHLVQHVHNTFDNEEAAEWLPPSLFAISTFVNSTRAFRPAERLQPFAFPDSLPIRLFKLRPQQWGRFFVVKTLEDLEDQDSSSA